MKNNSDNLTPANETGSDESIFPLELIQFARTDGIERRSYFTEKNANGFRLLLATSEKYAYRVKTLWILRDMLSKKWENEGSLTTNPMFPLLDTINEMIGCLLLDDIHFDLKGDPFEIIDGQYKYLPGRNPDTILTRMT